MKILPSDTHSYNVWGVRCVCVCVCVVIGGAEFATV